MFLNYATMTLNFEGLLKHDAVPPVYSLQPEELCCLHIVSSPSVFTSGTPFPRRKAVEHHLIYI